MHSYRRIKRLRNFPLGQSGQHFIPLRQQKMPRNPKRFSNFPFAHYIFLQFRTYGIHIGLNLTFIRFGSMLFKRTSDMPQFQPFFAFRRRSILYWIILTGQTIQSLKIIHPLSNKVGKCIQSQIFCIQRLCLVCYKVLQKLLWRVAIGAIEIIFKFTFRDLRFTDSHQHNISLCPCNRHGYKEKYQNTE